MAGRERLPTGVLGRVVRAGRVIGATAGRHAVRRTSGRGPASREEHERTATALADLLGSLKGGALKLGQLASFVELDAVPEPYRELYKERLGTLREQAPAVAWPEIERVLVGEWGSPVGRVVAELDPEPAAAASIGQVHRARLRDGREVAVKVQYPGVARAVDADLRLAITFMRALRMLAPGIDAHAIADELRERILEEIDYELEAAHQRAFARAYRDHPFVHIPEVVAEFSRARVLVTGWAEGERYDAVAALPDADRDRFAEILFRFYFGSPTLLGRFNADPHPGNYLLGADGTVTFLDFGAVKQVTREMARDNVAAAAAYVSGDAVELREVLAETGFFHDAGSFDAELIRRAAADSAGWVLEPGPRRLDPGMMREQLSRAVDRDDEVTSGLRRASLPADVLWFGRLGLSLFGVLCDLRACADWHAISREWWFGDPPATALGELEWEFLAERPLWNDPRAA